MSDLEISVLGSPRIAVDGAAVHVDTRKATAMLVYLAVTGRTQSRDRLTGLLWPDYDQERARAALRRTLSTLRKALGERWVSGDRLGISLDAGGVDLDLTRFRDLVALAAAHDHGEGSGCPGCIDALTRAVALGGGSFLHGFSLRDAEPFEEWQSLEAEAVERELAGALDRLVKALTGAGELETAIGVAERKLGLDPLDEPAHRQLMQLYAWRGMRTAALQQYRECVAVLDRELGVPPLPETTALYSAISEGAVEPREHSVLNRPAPRRAPGPAAYSLQGRAGEWELLEETYSNVSGAGALIVIEGEAGIGKTRLARDFSDAAAAAGARVVSARSYEGEADLPYALVINVLHQLRGEIERAATDEALLTELSRLVPGFGGHVSAPSPTDDPGAPARFLEAIRSAITDALGGASPGILFLDDLHWCDAASLDVLAYMARRLDDSPMFLIAGFRSEEVRQDHPLRAMFQEAARSSRVENLVLRRLGPEEVRALVREAGGAGEEDAEAVAQRLMQETEGIPLFVTEYLDALSTQGASGWEMPSSIKELLHSRIRLVGSTARQVIGAAAVIDRSFGYETVWRASGRTELEALDALDELVAHGLIVASPGGVPDAGYEFSHDKLRAVVYDALSPARRRVLHRRAAEAFVGAARRQEELRSLSSLIARHFELGGMEAEAARYHELAARHAREVFANREALNHYERALALGHPDPASMHQGAGDMHVLLGEYKKAIDSYETAAALARVDAIAEIERKLGEVHQRRGDWDLSQSHLVAALETLDETHEVERAGLLAAMSFNSLRKNDLDQAADLAGRALAAASAGDDPRALARAHNQVGILENARANHARAIEHLEASLELATGLEDAGGRVAALNNLAHARRSGGELDEALRLTEEALRICTQQGDSHRAAALHNNMADLLHEKGDTEGAMQHLKTSTAALARIGAEPTGLLPEVWKLVEW